LRGINGIAGWQFRELEQLDDVSAGTLLRGHHCFVSDYLLAADSGQRGQGRITGRRHVHVHVNHFDVSVTACGRPAGAQE
jgi:hypothetical protein